jgi:GNAT superfamily N-acetyltransferase
MEIRELKIDELDYAVLPCVDPGFRKTLKQGMNLRKEFLRKMQKQGLSVLVAFEDVGRKKKINYPGVGEVKVEDLSLKGKIPVGLLEYIPIEKTIFPVKGENLAFIHCIWVIPPYQRKGVALTLMENFFEQTSHFSGSAVIAYEGESWWGFFDYMPKWFFEKFGFKEVDRDGNSILMLNNYGNAKLPHLTLNPCPAPNGAGLAPCPQGSREKGQVEFFWSTQCPYSWWVGKLLEKEFGKTTKFELKLINTDERKTVQKVGITFGLRINEKTIFDRIPSWDEVKKTLRELPRT